MTAGSKKKENRDGFHRELHNHIRMLKREFDKIETIVTHTHRVETNNEEIMALQNLKDAKIRLLRIKFNHEADLIVQEFKDKVQEVLDRDGLTSCDLVNADDTDNNRKGKKGSQGKSRREDKGAQRGKRVSKKTDDKNTTVRRAPGQLAGKRTRGNDDADKVPDNNTEHNKTLSRSQKNEPEKSEDYDGIETESDEAEKVELQGKPLGKIRLQLGPGNSRRLVVERMEFNKKGERGPTPPRDGSIEAGPSAAAMESNKEGQGHEDQANSQRTVRRSGRERRQTSKVKESKRITRTRNPRR